jgi:hypothetical protein
VNYWKLNKYHRFSTEKCDKKTTSEADFSLFGQTAIEHPTSTGSLLMPALTVAISG